MLQISWQIKHGFRIKYPCFSKLYLYPLYPPWSCIHECSSGYTNTHTHELAPWAIYPVQNPWLRYTIGQVQSLPKSALSYTLPSLILISVAFFAWAWIQRRGCYWDSHTLFAMLIQCDHFTWRPLLKEIATDVSTLG